MIPAFVSFLNPDNAESWTSTRIVLLAIKHYNNLEIVTSKHGNSFIQQRGKGGGGGGGYTPFTPPRF